MIILFNISKSKKYFFIYMIDNNEKFDYVYTKKVLIVLLMNQNEKRKSICI